MRSVVALAVILSIAPACMPAQAQEPGAIAGRVVDAETRSPLAGVQVHVRGRDLGALTGEDGSFRIAPVPAGRYLVEYERLGYSALARPDVLVAPGRATQADAALHPAALELEGIVVGAGLYPKPEGRSPSVVSFNAEEIRRKPGSAGDVSRVLLALPSTAQVRDDANDLFVRGGSPIENGFYIDGIPVGNINHFPVHGSTGGPIGMLNLEFVDDVRFSAGGFSAVHGDRLSSIVEIKLREGSREDTEVGAELSMAALEAFAEGPLAGGSGSWLFSVRRSHLDLLVDAIGTGVAPRYGDLQGKATLDLDASNRISVLGLFGQSGIEFTRQEALDEGNPSFGDYANRQGTAGISWRHLWGGRGYSTISLSGSVEAAEDDWYRAHNADSLAQTRITEGFIRVRSLNRIRVDERALLEFGAELEADRSDYDYVLGARHDHLGQEVPPFAVDRRYEDERTGVFAHLVWTLAPRWRVSLGGRSDHFSGSGKTTHSPRLSTSLGLTDRLTLNAAAGLFRQSLPGFILAQDPAFLELPIPEAKHFVMGGEYLFDPATQLTLEAYWKEYDGLPLEEEEPTLFVLDDGTTSNRFRGYRTLVGSGRARAYGVEALLQKKLTDAYYGLVSASLSRSRYRALDGAWRDRAYDNRYLLNLVGGYRPSDMWEFSARWSLAGGAPYTPFDLPASQAIDSGVLDSSRINEARYPAYHSLNLQLSRTDVFRGSALRSYVALWNAYGRENVAQYYWNQVDNQQDAVHQWGLLPVLGLEWKF